MSGKELAEQTIKRFKTNNVSIIAEKAGIYIIYEKWFPITLGEFNKQTKTITINQNASIPQEEILAHELGHYFINESQLIYIKETEETIVREFTIALLANI